MSATPQLAHVGIFVRDVEAMSRFYTCVFDLKVSDQGYGRNFKAPLVFLSGTADQHHQLVLAGGRAADAPSTIMQLSFKVATLNELRRLHTAALAAGASKMRGMNHGNAWSIYFADLEDNTVEVYLDTPWYVPQPHGDPLDLSKTDADIWAETEALCRADPGFMPVADWMARFHAR